ncbi:MAG: SpaH/EbpB family LPXTG-anchored major pilin [Acutalibacteraceae bacterium]
MKITKKITSIVLALLLAVSAFAGLAITANAAYPTGNVTLTIHKYQIDEGTPAANNKIGNTSSSVADTQYTPTGDETPIEGVTFSAYKIGDITTAVPDTDPDNYDVTGITPKTGTTSSTGVATITVSSSEYGLYVVKETASPASVTTPAKAFYVYLPSTKSDGSDWLINVDVWPKNLVTLGGAVLTKTINNTTFANISDEDYAKLTVKPQFTLYKRVGGVDTVIAGPIEAAKGYTTSVEIADKDGVDYSSTAKIAQKDGVIAVDGLPVGTYVFKETTQAVYNSETLPLAPEFEFTVTKGQNGDVTLTDTDFAKTSGTVTAETRDNSSTPTVTKTVGTSNATVLIGETTSKTFQFGETVPYTITTSAPADIKTYKSYTITDKLDTQLQFTAGTVVVKNGETVLTAGTDYDLTEPAEENAYTLTVDLTATGIGKLAANSSVTVDFDATIKDTAAVNTAISNKAKITWTNANDRTGEPESTPVYVATLELKTVKVDSKDAAKLAGAEFKLELNGTPLNFTKTADGEYKVAPNGTDTLTSGADGKLNISGLKAATYTLTETKAPQGYQLLVESLTMIVNETSNTAVTVSADSNDIRMIKNVKQPNLPLTGGMGTILFSVAGIALIGGAAFFFIRSRKTRKEEI